MIFADKCYLFTASIEENSKMIADTSDLTGKKIKWSLWLGGLREIL